MYAPINRQTPGGDKLIHSCKKYCQSKDFFISKLSLCLFDSLKSLKIGMFRFEVGVRGCDPYWLCFVWTGGHMDFSLQASSTPLSNICLFLFPQEHPKGTGNNTRPLNDVTFDHWQDVEVADENKTKADWQFSTIILRASRKTLWLRLGSQTHKNLAFCSYQGPVSMVGVVTWMIFFVHLSIIITYCE